MPLYEYKCDKCGDVFEVRQKFSDEPVAVHEKCGGHVERLISRSGFRLKGSGWYATDYAKSGGNGSKKSDSESKSPSESSTKSETKSDTKSETKSESKSETKSTESKPSSSDKSKSE